MPLGICGQLLNHSPKPWAVTPPQRARDPGKYFPRKDRGIFDRANRFAAENAPHTTRHLRRDPANFIRDERSR